MNNSDEDYEVWYGEIGASASKHERIASGLTESMAQGMCDRKNIELVLNSITKATKFRAPIDPSVCYWRRLREPTYEIYLKVKSEPPVLYETYYTAKSAWARLNTLAERHRVLKTGAYVFIDEKNEAEARGEITLWHTPEYQSRRLANIVQLMTVSPEETLQLLQPDYYDDEDDENDGPINISFDSLSLWDLDSDSE